MEYIMDILKHEDIRLVDGRYSGGFVDDVELELLVQRELVEVYRKDDDSPAFVRLPR